MKYMRWPRCAGGRLFRDDFVSHRSISCCGAIFWKSRRTRLMISAARCPSLMILVAARGPLRCWACAGEPAQAGAGVGVAGRHRLLHSCAREAVSSPWCHAADASQIFLGFAQRLRHAWLLVSIAVSTLNDVARSAGARCGSATSDIASGAQAHSLSLGLAAARAQAHFSSTREINGMNTGGQSQRARAPC